jgi:hypothetical protein
MQPNLFHSNLCTVTRGHLYKIFVPRCNSDLRENFLVIKSFYHGMNYS